MSACNCTKTPTDLSFHAMLAWNSAKMQYCTSNFLSAMPINEWMQVGVRSYSKCYCIWPDFSVLAKRHKLVLNCHLKKYVNNFEDIFLIFKLFNNCGSHKSVVSLDPQFRFTCLCKNHISIFFEYYTLVNDFSRLWIVCWHRQ